MVNPNLVIVTRFISRFSKKQDSRDTADPSINVSEAFMGGGSQNDRNSSVSPVRVLQPTDKKDQTLFASGSALWSRTAVM